MSPKPIFESGRGHSEGGERAERQGGGRERAGETARARNGERLGEGLSGARVGWAPHQADFRSLEAAYPHAHTIFLVVDNWPVHFHPDVLRGLLGSKIQLLPLPTYAPWTNPVEKLRRLLAQHVLHLHAFADAWTGLQAPVQAWLAQFASGTRDLLRSCGLPDPY